MLSEETSKVVGEENREGEAKQGRVPFQENSQIQDVVGTLSITDTSEFVLSELRKLGDHTPHSVTG